MKRRYGPPLPPPVVGPPEQIRELSRVPPDDGFVTGNGFAAHCRFVLNYDSLEENPTGRDGWWFCRSDLLEYFFARLAPHRPYVLFTHNSDRTIDARFRRRLDDRRLVAWFAQNVELEHPKLHAIPIGIANPHWAHGDQRVIRTVIDARLPKIRLFDVSFDVATNPDARRYCLEQTGLAPEERLPFAGYLRRLAQSYFCICPRGAGVDAHRTWEALALGTVPVVTRTALTRQHPDLPLVVLDDWSEFRTLEFTPELHHDVWRTWTADAIRMDHYVDRIKGRLAASPA